MLCNSVKEKFHHKLSLMSVEMKTPKRNMPGILCSTGNHR